MAKNVTLMGEGAVMANAIGNTLYEIRQTEHLILLPGVWWGGERESETTLVALNFFFF